MTRPRCATTAIARRGLTLAAAGAIAALIARAPTIAARLHAIKLPADEARSALDAGRLVVLDVRTDRERAGGMIPGAVATSWRRPQLPGEHGEVLAVCSHGGRSLAAAIALRRRGIDARSLRGGIRAYERDGGAVDLAHR